MNKLRLAFFFFLLTAISMQALIASEINEEAPNCVLKTFKEAEPVTINQLKGKVLYVDFWASWCPPCRESIPFLNELHHDFSDQGLHILGVNLDEKLSDAKAFLAKVPARFDIMTDPDQQCAESFDVRAMPSSYLIDRNGVIRHIHLGFRSGDIEHLRARVQELL